AASAASASGSAIVSYACQFAGIPYVWGGSSLTSGVDCSGFTMAVFSHFGISLPHFAASQYGCGTPVSLSDLAPGDLVFYNGSSGSIEHVAIYVGGGSIIHARGTGYGVCYSSLNYDTPDAACRIV
ncbi:MAG: C40 family peptidase, partial [Lachnospiraceae bacterium]|nr:C40 family peptidase [Lachnospiraceae bacterium]